MWDTAACLVRQKQRALRSDAAGWSARCRLGDADSTTGLLYAAQKENYSFLLFAFHQQK